jgi:hypothetical protein
MCPVANENPLAWILEALFLQFCQLFKEGRDVYDNTSSNQVDTFRIHEAGGKEVEMVRFAIMRNGMT